MKNSFSLFEIILSLFLSSIVIIYSTLYIKEIFLQNNKIYKIEILKLDLSSTKIFLQKHKNSLIKLKYLDEKLYFDDVLLLDGVRSFNLIKTVKKIEININYKNMIKQRWIL